MMTMTLWQSRQLPQYCTSRLSLQILPIRSSLISFQTSLFFHVWHWVSVIGHLFDSFLCQCSLLYVCSTHTWVGTNWESNYSFVHFPTKEWAKLGFAAQMIWLLAKMVIILENVLMKNVSSNISIHVVLFIVFNLSIIDGYNFS